MDRRGCRCMHASKGDADRGLIKLGGVIRPISDGDDAPIAKRLADVSQGDRLVQDLLQRETPAFIDALGRKGPASTCLDDRTYPDIEISRQDEAIFPVFLNETQDIRL